VTHDPFSFNLFNVTFFHYPGPCAKKTATHVLINGESHCHPLANLPKCDYDKQNNGRTPISDNERVPQLS
jgi:hypothetical protein